MGVRDWLSNIIKKQQPMLPPANAIRHTKFERSGIPSLDGKKRIGIHQFTDTGITYPDTLGTGTEMKLYTFVISRHDSREEGGAGLLEGPYQETVCFEAPANWNINSVIELGYIENLIHNSRAFDKTFNKNDEIEHIGSFDLQGNYTRPNPRIQNYINNEYVPALKEQKEQERQARMKEENPGFILKAIGKILDYGDDRRAARKARIAERRAAREETIIEDPPLTRTERGLSPVEIHMEGKNPYGLSQFRIGNPEKRNIRAITLTNVEPLPNGEYLYTAFNENIGKFESAQTLHFIPNVQFVLPIAPENFDVFLKSLDDPANANAKNNMDALMELFEKKPNSNKGLFVGGLKFRESDYGLQYGQRLDIANMLATRYNRNRERDQQPDKSTDYQL